ncbi:ribonucleoside-diphosphate reductase subunit alpha [Candidatus Peregrinibacteria bacterium]|nr:ribonucleoside-diphosphate reductase subunit alpha [Candidatus Peregrinibacteria bacterium]
MIKKIEKIKKRNGEIVDFHAEKITRAVEKAFLAVRGGIDSNLLQKITDHVVKHIEQLFSEEINVVASKRSIPRTPNVEDVQNIVEKVMMEEGFFDVAKAYILYRYEHIKKREEEKKDILEKIEKNELSVTKRSGKTETFDLEKLKKSLTKPIEEHENLKNAFEIFDIDTLLYLCQKNLFEGIKTSEISQALIMAARSMIEKDPAYSYLAGRLLLNVLNKEVIGRDTVDYKKWQSQYREAFIQNIKNGVEIKRLDPILLSFDLPRLAGALEIERDNLLMYLGAQTLYDRYFVRNPETKEILETLQAFWMRVAMGLSIMEDKKEEAAIKFYHVISTLRFVPSTPTLFHSGTTHPQLSSCYLTTVSDSLEHIFKCIGDNAQLSKWSGGLGNDWTSIRGTGSPIKGTGVESQGVIPFLKIANDTTVAINRSGRRRGATCAYLETWHYDIEDYLELRKNTGDERRRTHDMNTSNWIPDLFMKRVRDFGDWTLFSTDEVPDLHDLYGKAFEKRYCEYEKMADEGKMHLFKKIKAVDLWRKMVSMLFETGHPWITFKDPCNIRSPQDHVGVVHSSNLCTEITLNTSAEETAVCNLGSVNLAKHIRSMNDEKKVMNHPENVSDQEEISRLKNAQHAENMSHSREQTSKNILDKELIEDTVRVAMRMLDNVIDINFYPTIEAKNSNLKHRPVGLGIMGFQDALYMLDINFDSEQAIEFADESMEVISYYVIVASLELAKERGVYSTFKGSKWDRGLFPMDTLDLLEEERGEKIDVARGSKLDWKPVRDAVKKYGMRNSNCMAIAPTATISNIAGCFPSIEPIYKNLYVKSNMSGEFTINNPYLVEDLKKIGLWNQEMSDEIKRNDGNIQNIDVIPRKLRDKYKETFDIDEQHLMKVTAHRGKWIDQSQSLNVFIKGTSGKKIANVYQYAWSLGLKTTYYLRSLAASGIEKSTLSLERQHQPIHEPTANTAMFPNLINVTQEESVQMTHEQPLFTEANHASKVIAACKINDPDCESCQ